MIDISVKNESEEGKLYEISSSKNTFRGFIEDKEFFCIELSLGDRDLFEEDFKEIVESDENQIKSIVFVSRLSECKDLLSDYHEEVRDIDGRETEVVELDKKLLSLV